MHVNEQLLMVLIYVVLKQALLQVKSKWHLEANYFFQSKCIDTYTKMLLRLKTQLIIYAELYCIYCVMASNIMQTIKAFLLVAR